MIINIRFEGQFYAVNFRNVRSYISYWISKNTNCFNFGQCTFFSLQRGRLIKTKIIVKNPWN